MQTSGECASTTQIVQKSMPAIRVSAKPIQKHRARKERSGGGLPCSLLSYPLLRSRGTWKGLAQCSVQAGDRRGVQKPAKPPPSPPRFLAHQSFCFSRGVRPLFPVWAQPPSPLSSQGGEQRAQSPASCRVSSGGHPAHEGSALTARFPPRGPTSEHHPLRG